MMRRKTYYSKVCLFIKKAKDRLSHGPVTFGTGVDYN